MKPPEAPCTLSELCHVLCVATERCNLACATCYTSQDGASLSLDAARDALDLLVAGTEQSVLHWSFTGGEPLSLGPDWLSRVLSHGDRVAAAHGVRMQWEIQSNLLLLNDELRSVLDEHSVRLGTSIDGPADLQELHRPGAGATVDIWRQLAAQGRPPGVLCVVSSESWRRRRELADFFAALGAPVLKLAPLRPLGRGGDLEPITASMLFEIRLEFIHRLLEGSTRFLDPDLLLYLRYYFQRRPPGMIDCTTARCGAGQTSISVDVDGALHPCIQPARVRGHVIGDVADGLQDDAKQTINGFHGSNSWTVRCFGCAARRICFYGCRAVTLATGEQPGPECGFTRRLWDFINERPDRALRLHSILDRQRREVEKLELGQIYIPSI